MDPLEQRRIDILNSETCPLYGLSADCPACSNFKAKVDTEDCPTMRDWIDVGELI